MSKLRNELESDRRNRGIENLIKEAVVSVLQEQAFDQAQQAAPTNVPPTAPAQPDAGVVDPNAAPPVADVTTIDTILEKLNVIRGGSSFEDPEVYGQLTTMFNSMDPAAAQVLDEQLNDIGKVVSIAEPQEIQSDIQANQQGTPPAQQPAPAPAPAAPPIAASGGAF